MPLLVGEKHPLKRDHTKGYAGIVRKFALSAVDECVQSLSAAGSGIEQNHAAIFSIRLASSAGAFELFTRRDTGHFCNKSSGGHELRTAFSPATVAGELARVRCGCVASWQAWRMPPIRGRWEQSMDTIQQEHCPRCFGTGQLVEMRPVQFGRPLRVPPPCPDCGGSGFRHKPRPVPIKSNIGEARRRRRPRG